MKKKSDCTIGIDLGDRKHQVCVLDRDGEVVEGKAIGSDRDALRTLARRFPGARVIIECGMQSPWTSRFLLDLGMEVIVANPRKVRAIWQAERKSDKRDAEMLARIGRMDPRLLKPIRHGSAEAQQELLSIKMRDALVRQRVNIISAIRFTLKSLGHRVSNPGTARFHKVVLEQVPAECVALIEPMVGVLAEMGEQIKRFDGLIKRAAEAHPVARHLQQIVGIGPITALYFVHKIEDPGRFPKARDVGAYLGLCPRRDQSGDCDKQLRISKTGDAFLRRLLVSAAQYILGHFGKDCALREFGLRLSERGGPRAKKKAVVAVARKLGVLMLSLWKSGEDYQARMA